MMATNTSGSSKITRDKDWVFSLPSMAINTSGSLKITRDTDKALTLSLMEQKTVDIG